MDIIEKELSDKIIGCAFEVYNNLGNGFLEKVYTRALLAEFNLQNISAVSQSHLNVYYKDMLVGEYYADIIVERKIILELKHAVDIEKIHIAQLMNYLKATKYKVGYIINFGNALKLQFKRIIF